MLPYGREARWCRTGAILDRPLIVVRKLASRRRPARAAGPRRSAPLQLREMSRVAMQVQWASVLPHSGHVLRLEMSRRRYPRLSTIADTLV